VQIGSDERFLSAPAATAAILSGPLLYITQEPQKELPRAAVHFAGVRFLARFERTRGSAVINAFDVYALSGFRGPVLGRMP
jgi:hypothetical protein